MNITQELRDQLQEVANEAQQLLITNPAWLLCPSLDEVHPKLLESFIKTKAHPWVYHVSQHDVTRVAGMMLVHLHAMYGIAPNRAPTALGKVDCLVGLAKPMPALNENAGLEETTNSQLSALRRIRNQILCALGMQCFTAQTPIVNEHNNLFLFIEQVDESYFNSGYAADLVNTYINLIGQTEIRPTLVHTKVCNMYEVTTPGQRNVYWNCTSDVQRAIERIQTNIREEERKADEVFERSLTDLNVA